MRLGFVKSLAWNLLVALFLPIFLLAALLPGKNRRYLIWGSAPLISNKYWSEAMKEAGLESLTVMQTVYATNSREDFDLHFDSLAPAFLPRPLRVGIGGCRALLLVLRRGLVLHCPFNGFALNSSLFWRLEGVLLRLAGVRTVILPYGGDFYVYSRMLDASFTYGALVHYPQLALEEENIAARIRYWKRRADAIVPGPQIDGLGRWDVTAAQIFAIDTKQWAPRAEYSDADGRNGAVRVIHTPNHRGAKGTEFVVDAVERLRAEGLLVELILVERVPNEEVRRLMRTADILAEQFLFTGYALSGIEGMASGLAVMANLENETYTRLLRRFSFLDECPILSTSPETLYENLRLLVRNPELRRHLGSAGRAYVEKYHSYRTAQYMFGAIHDRILRGRDVDLQRIFHPLLGAINRETPRIDHPLVESRLPADSPFRIEGEGRGGAASGDAAREGEPASMRARPKVGE